MLLSDRDHDRYDDDGLGSEQRYSEQYGSEDMEFEDGYGVINRPEWSHVLTVDEILNRRQRLSTVVEGSSVGSRSQAASLSQRSPGAREEDVPPVPRIPSIYRHQRSATEDHSPEPSVRSFHSRASTDPGVPPPSVSSTKSTASSVRQRIAQLEERASSPAIPVNLRPSSPGGPHSVGLGLALRSPSGIFSPNLGSMLSTPFSPAQSMPSTSPQNAQGPPAFARPSSYHSSQGSISGPRDRPASPVRVPSIRSYASSEGELNRFKLIYTNRFV